METPLPWDVMGVIQVIVMEGHVGFGVGDAASDPGLDEGGEDSILFMLGTCVILELGGRGI